MKDGFRHEYKYLISKADADILRLRLPHVMQRDPFVGPTGQYTIRSLYFDDFHNSALEEKISGIRDRAKYRIRYYNYDEAHLKLERKEKHGNLTRKLSQTISRECALDLQNGAGTAVEGLVGELQNACRYGGVHPMVLVDYDRTPFVCADGNTRITLDENLRTRPYCAQLFASSQAMVPAMEGDMVILEVKFDDFLPGYLDDALRDIPKISMAISKFALCMNLL